MILFEYLIKKLVEFEVAGIFIKEKVQNFKAVIEDILEVHLRQLELLSCGQLDEDFNEFVGL